MTAPLPEKFFDIRDVGAAGDVFDRFVVDGEDRGADEIFAREVGEANFELRFFARLEFGLRGGDLDVEHSFFRWDDEFLRFAMYFSVRDGDGLYEEVWHVFL